MFTTLVKAQDKPAVLAHYANNSTLWPTLSNTIREDAEAKSKYFDDFLPKIVGSGDIVWNHNVCQPLSDTHVMWSGVYTFQLVSGPTQARYSYLVAKNGDKWQIVHHHSSLMPEA